MNVAYHCYTIMSMHAVFVAVGTTVLLYNKIKYDGKKKEIKGLFY